MSRNQRVIDADWGGGNVLMCESWFLMHAWKVAVWVPPSQILGSVISSWVWARDATGCVL